MDHRDSRAVPMAPTAGTSQGTPTETIIGQLFGNYRVVQKIGMGVVYRAEHTSLGKHAALKVLRAELAEQPDIVTRFFNEARTASSIKHPGIVEMLDFGHTHGHAYILMEFLDGESLKARLQRAHRLSIPDALRLLGQLGRSLVAAHDAGIVHRDLKPDNILIVADSEVVGGERTKVLDFGIAKPSRHSTMESMTRTGTILGTPSYMSPEQCTGAGRVDHRADLYSLGCILFHLLCGRPPFVANGPGAIMAQHIYQPTPRPSAITSSVSPDVDELVLHLLAKEPAARVQTAAKLVARIDVLLQRDPSQHGQFSSSNIEPEDQALTAPMNLMPRDHTTLGSGAISLSLPPTELPRHGHRWLMGGVALSLLLLGSGTAMWLHSQSKRNPSTGAEQENRVAVAITLHDASVPADDVSPPAPVDASMPEGDRDATNRTYRVASSPTGATVTVDGKRAGQTPCEVTLSGAAPIVHVTLSGHESVTLEESDLQRANGESARVLLTPTVEIHVQPLAPTRKSASSPRKYRRKHKNDADGATRRSPRKRPDLAKWE